MVEEIIKIEMKNLVIPWPWNHLAMPIVSARAPLAAVSGHGLSSTR